MKQKFTIWLASIFMLTIMGVNAQFNSEWISPGATGNDFDDIEFVNETLGIAISNGGGIVKTVDGGATWNAVPAVTGDDLTDICWIDATNVVVGGNNGTLLYSSDAGSTWTEKYMGMGLNVRKVHFVSATVGFVVANSNFVYKTIDGGDSWKASAYENYYEDLFTMEQTFVPIQSIFFIDENKGWLVGNSATSAYTIDGGETWSVGMMDANLVLTLPHLYDVYFSDALNGVAIGASGTTVKTTDGGMSWMETTSSMGADLLSLVAGGGSLWATCSDANGVIYTSADAGTSWDVGVLKGPFGKIIGKAFDGTTDSVYVDGYNNGIVADIAYAGTKMVAVGKAGLSATSNDNGANWTRADNNVFAFNLWIGGIGFDSSRMIGYAGTNGQSNYPGNVNPKLYKSTDEGNTWVLLEAFDWGGGSNYPVTEVIVNPNDANHVLVLGRKRAQFTTDGGVTFQSLPVRYDDHFGAQWVDDSTAIVVGGKNVQMSTDTAKTWQVIFDIDPTRGTNEDAVYNMPSILSDCSFVDRYKGFVSGRSGGMMKTEDGGVTWVNISQNLTTAVGADLSKNLGKIDVDPNNPNNIVAAIDTRGILSSQDGGETWSYAYIGSNYAANAPKFIAPDVVWLAGKFFSSLSLDAGVTFSRISMPGIAGNKQLDDLTILNSTTLLETGAAGSGRETSSIIRHTIPEGYFSTGLATQATNIVFSNASDTTQISLEWTRGTGEACAVFVRMYDENDLMPNLEMFNNYVASAKYGAGQRSLNGWYCVYDGTGNSVTITDLPMNARYTAFVAEYKSGYLYNGESAAGNSATSDLSTGLRKKIEALTGFAVYPNPTGGMVTLQGVPANVGTGHVQIINLLGTVVVEDKAAFSQGANQLTYDISDLPSGVYLIKVVIGGNTSVKRIVKK